MPRIMERHLTAHGRMRGESAASRVLRRLPTDSAPTSPYNLTVGDRRTSFRVDDLTWQALAKIAHLEGTTMQVLVEQITAQKAPDISTAAAMRTFVISYLLESCSAGQEHRQALSSIVAMSDD